MVRTIRKSYFGVLALLAAIVLLCVLASSSVALPGATTRVSVDSSGAEGFGSDSYIQSISSDGRYVVFQSAAGLVADDTNGFWDIYVRDRQTGTTQRVSVDSSGTQTVGFEFNDSGDISADGRYVVFSSEGKLVADDTNDNFDVFVHDRQTGTTRRVSVDSSGTQANGGSTASRISADGRYVTFTSDATNLVADDTTGSDSGTDVFVRDLQAGTTQRVSVDSSGTQAEGTSFQPSISANGRYVVFDSDAPNLVAGDTNGTNDVFVRDLQTGSTERVSVDSSGTEANIHSLSPSISADGRYVAFASFATNLVAGDTNDAYDAFVHDRQTKTTQRVSVAGCAIQSNHSSFNYPFPSISADGHHVAFASDATNLVAGDTNGTNDVFVRDLQTGSTERVSVDSSGTEANGGSFISYISADGLLVAFQSNATNLVPDDTNGTLSDVFVHERQTGTAQPNDGIAPTTTACASINSGPYEPDTWTNQDVQLSFSAQDNEDGAGVKDISFSAIGAQSIPETVYNTYNSPVINTDGVTTISYFATDNEGNQESPAKTFTVKLDKTPPTVSSTSPKNNATGVAATAKISATFLERDSGIDPNSLTTDNFIVEQLKPTGNVPVSGTLSYNGASQTVTFTPSRSLAKGAYRATINGAADKAGNVLANDSYTWLFTTAGPSKK